MKKYILFLVLIFLVAASCEKDDFCIDPITPELVIRFYDNDNQTSTLVVTDLTVWPEGRDTILLNQNLDSIAIPLDVNNPETIYNFQSGDLIDQMTITYTVDEIFVSRSCGFKANFTDLDANLESSNWIQAFAIISTTVEDESAAHIEIFH